MDFAIPSHLVPTLDRIDALMSDAVLPNEREVLQRGFIASAPLLSELRARVKAARLWGPQIPKVLGGLGLDPRRVDRPLRRNLGARYERDGLLLRVWSL